MESKAVGFIILIIVLLISILAYQTFFDFEKEKVPTKEEVQIDEAQKISFQANVNAIIRNLEQTYILTGEAQVVVIEDGAVVKGEDISMTLPDEGKIILNNEGEIAFALVKANWCAKKGFADNNFTVVTYDNICHHDDLE